MLGALLRIAPILRSKAAWVTTGAALIVAFAYFSGKSSAEATCEARRLSAVERTIEQAQRLAAQDAELLTEAAELKREIEIHYETIYIEGAKSEDIDTGCKFSPSFERLWNDANASANAAPVSG